GQMRAFHPENRMHATGCKTGTDSWRELQGRSKHRARKRHTLLVVIRIPEQEPAILPARIDEFGSLNLAVFHEVPIMIRFLNDQSYLTTGLDLCAEAPLPLKDLRKLRREIFSFWKVC